MELEGTVAGRTAFKADQYTLFPSSMTSTFDMDLYKEMVELSSSDTVRNNWIITDVSDHHGGIDGKIELINRPNENPENDLDMMGDRSFIDM